MRYILGIVLPSADNDVKDVKCQPCIGCSTCHDTRPTHFTEIGGELTLTQKLKKEKSVHLKSIMFFPSLLGLKE